MADVYATIAKADPALAERLAQVLELRAASARQKAMRAAFLDAVPFAAGASVVEIGSGTGALCRDIAARPGVARVVGVDPSPHLAARARALSPGLEFIVADGRDTGLPGASFEVVVICTTLCHVPQPERALAEAFRLLRPGGVAAVFDGDYAMTSAALGADDPLQACMQIAVREWVLSPWLARSLAPMMKQAGFVELRSQSHGYVDLDEPDYLLSLIDRGSEELRRAGLAGEALAAALRQEARDRHAAGRFFGHIPFFHVVGRKPG